AARAPRQPADRLHRYADPHLAAGHGAAWRDLGREGQHLRALYRAKIRGATTHSAQRLLRDHSRCRTLGAMGTAARARGAAYSIHRGSKMRLLLRFVAAAVIASALASAARAEHVKVSYPNLNGSYIYFFTAIDKGFYKDEGFDLEVVESDGGTATAA